MSSYNPVASIEAYLEDSPGSGHPNQDRFTPLFAVRETPNAYDIQTDLPHTTRSDVKVRPHRCYVEICCEHAIDHDGTEQPPRFGSFTTRIPFGSAIDARHASTTLVHGVLRIHAPKLDA